MKKTLVLFFLSFVCIGLFSCKKCATCSNVDAKSGEDVVEEFCETGKVYKDQLDAFEKAGWKCTEK